MISLDCVYNNNQKKKKKNKVRHSLHRPITRHFFHWQNKIKNNNGFPLDPFHFLVGYDFCLLVRFILDPMMVEFDYSSLDRHRLSGAMVEHPTEPNGGVRLGCSENEIEDNIFF